MSCPINLHYKLFTLQTMFVHFYKLENEVKVFSVVIDSMPLKELSFKSGSFL